MFIFWLIIKMGYFAIELWKLGGKNSIAYYVLKDGAKKNITL